MTPTAETLTLPLFQPEKGFWIAPIRHHSPACAWAVRAMIRELRPDQVLIEAPEDMSTLIDIINDPLTRPPVAGVTLQAGRVAYMPLCEHSPEYVAMQTAKEIGATIRFIDLPAAKVFERDGSETGQISVVNEMAFNSGDYVKALCARTGCRDGFELWDHMFEARLGEPDWKRFLNDVGVYCAGMRAATPEQESITRGDHKREKAMAGHITEALTNGTVVAVVGGFHAPALVAPTGKAQRTPKTQDSYLVRYGHAAMDAIMGYGAGMPQPGYYDALWKAAEAANGVPDWNSLTSELMQDFTSVMLGQGHVVSLPAKVETLRMAGTLALMRGRMALMRHDLFDGVQASLTKGEVSSREPWSDRLRLHWRGTALGDVPPGISAPPLVEDARSRAIKHRLDVSDSLEKKRALDIQRKPRHLDASRFLHAMALLDVGFAHMETGPDYVSGFGTDRLFENWLYTWSPTVETRLIELAARGGGDTVPDACLAHIWARRTTDLATQLALLGQGIRAGLGTRLNPIVAAFAQDMGQSGSFAEMGRVLQRLYVLCHTRGPMRTPEELGLNRLLQVGYARLIYLADDLPHVPEDMAIHAVAALRLVADLLTSDTEGVLDQQAFYDAILRLSSVSAPPDIIGAVLSLALKAGLMTPDKLVDALQGEFSGVALEVEDRIGVLRGVIAIAPDLLWQVPSLLNAIDGFLSSLEEAEFLRLLPVLRRAFTALNPKETDRLAEMLSNRHGGALDIGTTSQFTEADLMLGLRAHQAMLNALQADGLE